MLFLECFGYFASIFDFRGLQADLEAGPVHDFHHRESSRWSCHFSSNQFKPISSIW